MANTKLSDLIDDVIVLRSVYSKTGNVYFTQPAKDPKTGRYPECVKDVDSHGDMILTNEERLSDDRKYFVKTTDVFKLYDGISFNLKDPYERNKWEAIKHCVYIAPDREAKDENGNYLIDGTMDWKSKRPRYGVAELYVDRPGLEAQKKVTRKQLIHKALSFIFDDERGAEGRLLRARLLGKNMKNMPDADVTDFLMDIAEKTPERIVNIYTGGDTSIRMLFMDAKEQHKIYKKDGIYLYGDNVQLGVTDEAVIQWFKDSKNKKMADIIRKEVYPEYNKQDTKSEK